MRRGGAGNRIMLAVIGLILLAAGAAALVRGLDYRPALLGSARDLVTGSATKRYAHTENWFWPVVAVGSAAIGLIALRWLLIQGRVDTVRELALEGDPRHGVTRLPASAVTAAVQDDLSASPYVQRVRATLSGSATTPRLALNVTLQTGADPVAASQRISAALERLSGALETDRLATVVRVRTTDRR
jgi:hypothetical protein